MRVLITGGYGFIGSKIAERFYKEGHKIFILDNLSTGRKSNINFEHTSLITDIENENCGYFFDSHKFDIVIHCAAQTDVHFSTIYPNRDAQVNLVGLSNMLHLSGTHKVQKFVFASSAAVYGDAQVIPTHEDIEIEPISPYGISKHLGEIYCQTWTKIYGLSTLIFRFSNVYGPQQQSSKESGVLTIFLNKLQQEEPITIFGDGLQTRDFIFVEDVADAIYRGVVSDLIGVYNLSTQTSISIQQITNILQTEFPTLIVNYDKKSDDDIMHSCLDNSKIKRDLDWIPKYSIQEGLQKTLYTEQPNKENLKNTTSTIIEYTKRTFDKAPFWLPYLEHFSLFLLFLIITKYLNSFVDEPFTLLVYIIVVATLFGKAQAIIASLLATAIYMLGALGDGRTLASLFIDNTFISLLTMYLLVGLFVGYIVDKRKSESIMSNESLANTEDKLQFLTKIYENTREVKNSLQEQILHSEDSIGKIYSVTTKLDSLEPDEIFSSAINVLEKLLKTKKFGIFILSPDMRYLRMMAKSNSKNFELNSSIKVENNLFKKVITEQKIAFNFSLNNEDPIFASPIIQNNKVIAVIAGYDVPFDHLNLYYRNLIDVVTKLINTSLLKAYTYLIETEHERYLPNTKILNATYLERVIQNKEQAKKELNIPYQLITINSEQIKNKGYYDFQNILRTNDYTGLNEFGQIVFVLSNADEFAAQKVIARLSQLQYEGEIHQKEPLSI